MLCGRISQPSFGFERTAFRRRLKIRVQNVEENQNIVVQSQLQAAIVIPAAPERVWLAFRQVENWNQWYPGVLAASWQQGSPWTAASQIRIQVKNSLGRTMDSIATVHPSAAELLIWENQMPGLITLCHARAFGEGNGTRFVLHKAYRGYAVPLLLLLKARQQRMLNEGLRNLEKLVLDTQE